MQSRDFFIKNICKRIPFVSLFDKIKSYAERSYTMTSTIH